jgi:sarcosine oxidase gamma subunit
MDNSPATPTNIALDGLSVSDDRGFVVASLRYFDPRGSFADAVREIIGQPLPEPLHAAKIADATPPAHFILAWRSPTETLLLCSDGGACARLESQLATAVDGCMLDQTGGMRVIRVQGRLARDLLLRLGSSAGIPRFGEARSSRLAELHVLTVCVQAGEFLLLVERAYSAHLLEWIGATVADF